MPIKISTALINKLPEEQRDGLEEFLWTKSGGHCFLCEQDLHRASEPIEADHDLPEASGGANSRENLNLAHVDCNRAKRAAKSVDIRPYLKLSGYIRRKGGYVKYGDLTDHFDLSPSPSIVTYDGGSVTFEFPDDSVREVPTFSEETPRGDSFRYTFVDVPRNAVFNDDDVQPRTIKLAQIWAIYQDLQANPLHEPPGCRLAAVNGQATHYQLVMFDGQHKTTAAWMRGSDRVMVKVYLDLETPDAVRLVNSIQAKIKKLPLSPFELAAKLSDEWANKLSEYQEDVGAEEASEQGFLAWLPKEEQARGKQAFRAALVQNILALSSDDLRFLEYVRRAGSRDADLSITENTFKSKVLERLLHLNPLAEVAAEADVLRTREKDNVVRALNNLTDLAFEPAEGAVELSDREQERVRRMSYQSALAYIATLLKELYRQVLVVDQERALFEREPTDAEWQQIVRGIERLVDHPVWNAKFDASQKMRDLEQALSKNQDAKKSFGGIGLKLAYLVGAEELGSDWAD
jgi:hypothetical protein